MIHSRNQTRAAVAPLALQGDAAQPVKSFYLCDPPDPIQIRLIKWPSVINSSARCWFVCFSTSSGALMASVEKLHQAAQVAIVFQAGRKSRFMSSRRIRCTQRLSRPRCGSCCSHSALRAIRSGGRSHRTTHRHTHKSKSRSKTMSCPNDDVACVQHKQCKSGIQY